MWNFAHDRCSRCLDSKGELGGNMGSLDQPTGSATKRKIKFIDVTGLTPTQLETAYNTNYGEKGWRLIQMLEYNAKLWAIAEKES